eukprot:TRINITY_DN48419_c0_g1_i1.p1 TRINITY_DN48419_c0_g1~~TRINITY_DN48419_c0_g1_i1.p1  ORF type:complete len:245 (+),score=14.92 TRINITY_DN48419_c0_g1_i1:72-806(+)
MLWSCIHPLLFCSIATAAIGASSDADRQPLPCFGQVFAVPQRTSPSHGSCTEFGSSRYWKQSVGASWGDKWKLLGCSFASLLLAGAGAFHGRQRKAVGARQSSRKKSPRHVPVQAVLSTHDFNILSSVLKFEHLKRWVQILQAQSLQADTQDCAQKEKQEGLQSVEFHRMTSEGSDFSMQTPICSPREKISPASPAKTTSVRRTMEVSGESASKVDFFRMSTEDSPAKVAFFRMSTEPSAIAGA